MNPSLDKLKGEALHWAKESLAQNLDEADAADEDILNRILWYSVRGRGGIQRSSRAGKRNDCFSCSGPHFTADFPRLWCPKH